MTSNQHPDLDRVISGGDLPEKNRPARTRAYGELGLLMQECRSLGELGLQLPNSAPMPATPSAITGTMTDYPLLALLAVLPSQSTADKTTLLRGVTAALVEATLTATNDQYADASNSLYQAGLAARTLIKQELSDSTACALTPSGSSSRPQEWQAHLRIWVASNDGHPLHRLVAPIERALAFLIEVRNPRPGGTAGSRPSAVPDSTAATGDTREPDVPAYENDIGTAGAPAKTDDAEATHSGVIEGENDTNDLAGETAASRKWPAAAELVDVSPPHPREVSTKGPRLNLSRMQAAAIRADRQNLPGVELHATQARAVLAVLQTGQPRTRALAAAALYIGEPSALTNLHVAHQPKDIPASSDHFWLTIQPFTVRIPNRVSPILPKAPEGRNAQAVASSIEIQIPIAGPGARKLRATASIHLHHHLRHASGSTASTNGNALADSVAGLRASNDPLFSSDDVRAANAYFKSIPAPRTVTCNWLANVQIMFCEAKHGGSTDIALAIRAANDLSYRTRAHYRSLGATEASALRQELICDTVTWTTGKTVSTDLIVQPGSLGSHRCPHVAEVATWVAFMQEKLASAPLGRPAGNKVRSFHNAFMGYSLALLTWSCGPRMSQAALEQLFAGEPLILQDKGEVGGARIAVLPSIARRQLAHVEDHLRCIERYLDAPMPTTWFWLDEDCQPRRITPKWLHAATNSPFVDNAPRHSFVTGLMDLRVREDRVAMFVGHRSLGSEVWDPWSAMDPMPCAEELRAIEHHLARCGWRDIKGYVGARSG